MLHCPLGEPFTVQSFAQQFTSCALQAFPLHCTVHVSPPQPTILQASLPVHVTLVVVAVPRTSPHD